MRTIHKKTITILIAIILCLISFWQSTKVIYAGSSNKYLVLIQQKNGSWKEYHNLVEKSDHGSLMIKAKKLSKIKALGITYKKDDNGTFVMKRSATKYNTYIKGSMEFTYTNGAEYTLKFAPNIAYTSKLSNSNVCQVSTLSTLVNFKYFNGADTKDYKNYSGVICYSKYKKIPNSAPQANPKPTIKPTPTPEPEPAFINIEGVEFPVRDHFLSMDDVLSDWGGTALYWGKLEQEVDRKFIPSTDLTTGVDSIGFSHLAAGSDGVYLTKTSSGYKLTISVKLAGSITTDQNAAIVKAMVATISSKPTLVYTAIFESFTTEDTHGINEDKYVVIGDCKIKVAVKDGSVIYYIKEA